MKHNIKNLTGLKFGKLSVIEYAGTNSRRQATWLCLCECGKQKIAVGTYLRRSQTASCGCKISQSRKRHGMTKTGAWNSWRAMMKRCYQTSHTFYNLYGGAGITVCDRWHVFENFYADMGERPENMTIDRIDTSGCYSPENCRWATMVEQAGNKRNSRLIYVDGERKTARQWSLSSGTPCTTIEWRFKSGWEPHEVVYGRQP